MERAAEDAIREFDADVLNAPRSTPIVDIVRHARDQHGLQFKLADNLPDMAGTGQLLGKFFFNPPVIYIHHNIVKTVRFKFTLAHEFAHFYLHRDLKIKLGNYIHDSEQDVFGKAPPARKWMEWQANRFAAALLVPRRTVSIAMQNAFTDVGGSRASSPNFQNKVIKHVSIVYDVSESMMRYRLRELEEAS